MRPLWPFPSLQFAVDARSAAILFMALYLPLKEEIAVLEWVFLGFSACLMEGLVVRALCISLTSRLQLNGWHLLVAEYYF